MYTENVIFWILSPPKNIISPCASGDNCDSSDNRSLACFVLNPAAPRELRVYFFHLRPTPLFFPPFFLSLLAIGGCANGWVGVRQTLVWECIKETSGSPPLPAPGQRLFPSLACLNLILRLRDQSKQKSGGSWPYIYGRGCIGTLTQHHRHQNQELACPSLNCGPRLGQSTMGPLLAKFGAGNPSEIQSKLAVSQGSSRKWAGVGLELD